MQVVHHSEQGGILVDTGEGLEDTVQVGTDLVLVRIPVAVKDSSLAVEVGSLEVNILEEVAVVDSLDIEVVVGVHSLEEVGIVLAALDTDPALLAVPSAAGEHLESLVEVCILEEAHPWLGIDLAAEACFDLEVDCAF